MTPPSAAAAAAFSFTSTHINKKVLLFCQNMMRDTQMQNRKCAHANPHAATANQLPVVNRAAVKEYYLVCKVELEHGLLP